MQSAQKTDFSHNYLTISARRTAADVNHFQC